MCIIYIWVLKMHFYTNFKNILSIQQLFCMKKIKSLTRGAVPFDGLECMGRHSYIGGTNPNFFRPGWFQVPFVITNHPTIFFFTKNTVWPPLPGVSKNRPPHYMAKNENHPRWLCDSLNEAFWCTDCNAKNLTSLWSLISEKMRKNHQKMQFFQKCPFFTVFLDFSRNGTF